MKDFFSSQNEISSRSDSEVAEIASQILFEMDLAKPFIEDMMSEYGEPCWECAFQMAQDDAFFEVAIPLKLNDKITSIFIFMQNDQGSVNIFFSRKKLHDKVIKYERAATTIVEDYYYSEFDRQNLNTEDALSRSACCSGTSSPTYFQVNDGVAAFSTSGFDSGTSHCTCYDSSTPGASWPGGTISHNCCKNNTGNLQDGGQFEAGSDFISSSDFGNWDLWIEWYSDWLERWTEFANNPNNGGPHPGGGANTGGGVNSDFNDNPYWNDAASTIAQSVLDYIDCLPDDVDGSDYLALSDFFDSFLDYVNANTSFPINTNLNTNIGGGLPSVTVEGFASLVIGRLNVAGSTQSASDVSAFLDFLQGIDCEDVSNANGSTNPINEEEECNTQFDSFIESLGLDLSRKEEFALRAQIEIQMMANGGCSDAAMYTSTAAEITANFMHTELLGSNTEYSAADFDFEKFKEECGAENYLKAVRAFEDMPETEEFVPLITYALKELAKFGAGAVMDFAMQIGIEYVIGDHSSFESAWNNANINKFTIFSSGIEAICKNKFVAVGGSAAADLLNYVTTANEITAAGLGAAFTQGAIGGLLGAYAGDLIEHLGKTIAKYGPQQAIRKLKELGDFIGPEDTPGLTSIYQHMLQIKDFRDFMVESIWDKVEPRARGFLMEEILRFNRYKNYTWVNQAGEQNGPLDFILDNFGIQLKTSQHAALTGTGWSAIRAHAKKGLEQIYASILAGDITNGSVDIMVPKEFEGIIDELADKLMENLGVNDPNSNFYGIIINIFVE